MAAEKLTKARLIQIFIMMLILVSAFIWRTLTYEKQNITCAVPNNCTVLVNTEVIEVLFSSVNSDVFTYSLKSKEIIEINIVKGEGIVSAISEQWNFTSQSAELKLEMKDKDSVYYLIIKR